MADYEYFSSTGIIIPDTAELRDQVEAEYISAFGSDIDLDPSTPQGMLITIEVLSRARMIRNNAALLNQINPNYAGDVFLDAVCNFTGLDRDPATRSTISGVTVTGIPGSIIYSGSKAKTADGDIFITANSVILNGAGTGVVDFISEEFGQIPAAIGQLNTVVSAVLGWETVSNTNAAVLGNEIQSDSSLRQKRKRTLASQNTGMPESIISALYLVDGVKSLSFLENVTGAPAVIDGINLASHSIWACVQGGLDTDIASALLENKDAGAGWNGAVVVASVDPASGQSYNVSFDRPSEINIKVRATVRDNGSTIDPTTAVRDAILDFAANTIDGVDGYSVGQDVSPFEIASAITLRTNNIYVQLLEISDDGITWITVEYAIAIDEIADTQSGDITVIIS